MVVNHSRALYSATMQGWMKNVCHVSSVFVTSCKYYKAPGCMSGDAHPLDRYRRELGANSRHMISETVEAWANPEDADETEGAKEDEEENEEDEEEESEETACDRSAEAQASRSVSPSRTNNQSTLTFLPTLVS